MIAKLMANCAKNKFIIIYHMIHGFFYNVEMCMLIDLYDKKNVIVVVPLEEKLVRYDPPNHYHLQ